MPCGAPQIGQTTWRCPAVLVEVGGHGVDDGRETTGRVTGTTVPFDGAVFGNYLFEFECVVEVSATFTFGLLFFPLGVVGF